MKVRNQLLTLILFSFLFGTAFYPAHAQHGNTHGASVPERTKPLILAHSLERHQEIQSLAKEREHGNYRGPQFVKTNTPDTVMVPNTILFTFSETDLSVGPGFSNSTRKTTTHPELHVSRVEIVFAHEGWRVLHPLQKTKSEHGHGQPIFFLYFDVDRHVQQELLAHGKPMEYRLVVDGVWMADPGNPLSVRKMNGSLVSIVDLTMAPPPSVISPEVIPPPSLQNSRVFQARPESATLNVVASRRQARTAIVRWVGPAGQSVYVAGTFNHFDPYMYPMEAVGPDPRNPERTVYELKLRLLAGQYYYHFVINGNNYLDPLNIKHGRGPEGRTYSQLQIP